MVVSIEQKVGLFFLFALIMLGVMIELVEDWRPFEAQYDYVALFTSSIGLNAGDPVRVAGVEVGKVRSLTIEDGKVKVDFYINGNAVIRRDSIARIRQTNLLGGTFLGLDFGSPGSEVLPPGSVVTTTEGANFDELIANLDRNQDRILRPLGELLDENRKNLTDSVEKLSQILTKIDKGDGTLGQLVNNPVLFDEVVTTSVRLNKLLRGIEQGEGTLGKLMKDTELYDNLNRTMVSFESVAMKINEGKGTLSQLLVDDHLYKELTITLEGLREITEKVNSGQGLLGRLVNDETLYEDLREGIVRINSIAAKIDDGTGTLGRLVNEDTLYRDAVTTLHKVEKTVDGMSDTGPISALGVVLGTLF
jgi:phospholipid/cholesterol/gamma-HCH transport system substrate-binding protein